MIPVGSHAHKVATTGYGESALRGAAQGATFGFADEITGLLESILTDKKYTQARDESRANYDIAHEANPKMTAAGEMAGGLASAALPIPGLSLGKGASIGKEILFGSELGAATGLGNSRADIVNGELGQAFQDTKNGALLGGGAGLVMGGATRAVGAGGKAIGGLLKDAVDPTTQRLLALGATAKNFKGPLGDKSAKAVEVFKREGLFDKLVDGSEPELQDIAQLAETKRSEAAQKLQDLFAQHGDKTVNVRDIAADVVPQLREIVNNAPPDLRDSLTKSMKNLWQEVSNTGGNLSELWALKKRTGGWVGPAWDRAGQPPPLKEAFMKLNSSLEELLEANTVQFAKQHNLESMRHLNDTYGAMSTLGKTIEDKVAKGLTNDPLNVRLRDASIFSVIGGAAGGAMGGGAGAALGAAAGGLLGRNMSSPAGRLFRARIGERLHVGEQAQAVAQGAMPRSTVGIQKFLTTNQQQVMSAYPQFAQQIMDIIKAPPSMAEARIRLALPVLVPFLAHSPFPSELDGKVSSEQDKMMARKMMDELHMLPSEAAAAHSKLSKTGELHPAIFAPSDGSESQSDDPIADQVLGFSQRLETMYNGR